MMIIITQQEHNEMMFGFFGFIIKAVLVIIAIIAIIVIPGLVYAIVQERKGTKASIEKDHQEKAFCDNLLKFDTTKIVLEFAYTALLKALAEKTTNLQNTPHYIENLNLDFRIFTYNGTVSLYVDSHCVQEIDFYRDLHKENILHNDWQNSAFSATVANLMICRLESEDFQGINFDTNPQQEVININNQSILRDATICITIKNPNYEPPQSWSKI